jgi:precorrin-3B synthase
MTSTLARDLSTPTPDPSPQGGEEHAQRRGACPGLSAPMQTGDGLLVRLLPVGTVALTAFAELCAAARTFGNGIIEVTARGSVQVRGLDAASAPRFAAAIGALGIAAEDGIPVHVGPLTGLDPDEMIDAGKLAADLRRALAHNTLASRLSPKVSVTIDDGGLLSLDELAADVRLRAEPMNGDVALAVNVGGDGASAMHLGFVAPADGVETAIRLLKVIAQRGRAVRARDILAAVGIETFRLAVSGLLLTPARPRESVDPELDSRLRGNERKLAIGLHRQRGGLLAFGIGLAFGHADAASLEALAKAAAAAGAIGMRTAPGRALIVIGPTRESLPAFVGEAERRGFIVRGDDPRRFVIACAGAPVCASAHIAARAMAPRIAAESAQFLGGSFTVHLSGCAKGCAHPALAALTAVGTAQGCALIASGAARDAPFAVVAPDALTAAIARYAGELTGEDRHV